MANPLRSLFSCTLFVLITLPAPASAQVVLKPRGQTTLPLRTKVVRADVRIEQQFATTKLDLTFQNETSSRIEADFLYSLPPDTVVTSFAYWYGDEKVAARIVEKERAAQIYGYITSRLRDPALIEMLDQNTFRARIFPVLPNADLKVEMTLVQVLPSDAEGAWLELPLKAEKGSALEQVDVRVQVRADPGLSAVTNNYGLPVGNEDGAYRITLSGTNYRPEKDLRVNLRRKPQAVQAALYSARSGGPDGFFALALTADHTLARPQVRIQGVSTYAVVPALPREVPERRTLALFGRYRGDGPAVVRLTGFAPGGPRSYTAPLTFSGRSEPNNLAVKLWAARWIEALSAAKARPGDIIALSVRHTLPSRYTSWLAVPQAEKELYERERLQAEIATVARQVVREIALGSGSSRRARQLRRRLHALCRKAGSDPADALRSDAYDHASIVAEELSREILAGRGSGPRGRRLRGRLRTLARLTQQDPTQLMSGEVREAIAGLGEQLAEEVEAGRAGGPAARRLRTRLGRLAAQVGAPWREALGHAPREWVYGLAEQLIRTEGPERKASLRGRLNRLARYFGVDGRQALAAAERSWASGEVERVRDILYAERRKPAPDPERVRALEAEFLALHRRLEAEEEGRTRMERLAAKADLERLDQAIETAIARPGQPQLAQLQRRRVEIARREEELRARMGDPLIQITAPQDAERVVALMPDGDVKCLSFNPQSGKWEARFDIPTYAAEGEYAVTVVVLLKDGTRQTLTFRYHVDVTAPAGAGRVRLETRPEPVVRLEVDGSPDTARVSALLPWREQAALQPSVQQPGRFFALVPLPASHRGVELAVTFILTDRAHNRTIVMVDAGSPGLEAGAGTTGGR